MTEIPFSPSLLTLSRAQKLRVEESSLDKFMSPDLKTRCWMNIVRTDKMELPSPIAIPTVGRASDLLRN